MLQHGQGIHVRSRGLRRSVLIVPCSRAAALSHRTTSSLDGLLGRNDGRARGGYAVVMPPRVTSQLPSVEPFVTVCPGCKQEGRTRPPVEGWDRHYVCPSCGTAWVIGTIPRDSG